jgi:hypothetical protein
MAPTWADRGGGERRSDHPEKGARADPADLLTVRRVPKPAPPPRTRHGNLHAVGRPSRLPVNAQSHDGDRDGRRTDEPGLLGRLVQLPTPPVDAPPVVSRRLDRGRLAAAKLVQAAGWPARTPLRAELAGPGRIRLRPETRAGRFSKYRAHVDAKGQIQLVLGLRTHLGVADDGEVLARLLPDGIVEIANYAVVHAAFDAFDTLAELERRVTAPATAAAEAG